MSREEMVDEAVRRSYPSSVFRRPGGLVWLDFFVRHKRIPARRMALIRSNFRRLCAASHPRDSRGRFVRKGEG